MNFLADKMIVIDPGHGGTAQTDFFRQGRDGLREENINLSVALLLEELLMQAQAQPFLTRQRDEEVSLEQRVQLAIEKKADVFISIHHNSSAPVDRELNFSCVFIHGQIGETESHNFSLADSLAREFKMTQGERSFVFSDQLLFEEGLGVLKGLNRRVCAVLGEFSFFSNPQEEALLATREHCLKEARAYFDGLSNYFKKTNQSSGDCIQNIFKQNTWVPFLKECKDKLLAQSQKQRMDHFEQGSWNFWLQEAETQWAQKNYKQAQLCYQNSLSLLVNSPEILKSGARLFECVRRGGGGPEWIESFAGSIDNLAKEI